jgi:sugar phosphate isomerase/epimerase
LGVSSSLKHSSPKEWAKKHQKLGLSAINFPLSYQEDMGLIETYANEAKAHDLTIAEVGVWRNTMALDPEVRREAIQYTIGQLELADQLNARCCVNIMGARGARWDGAYQANFTKETWALGVKTIQEIIDTANPRQTYFTVESMPWMFPTSPDEYLQLLEAVDRDRFSVHLDIFNWITTPRRYFFQEAFINDCFEKLGKHIKSCHLKDVKLEDDYTLFFRETYAGNGGIDIKHLIETGISFDENMPFIIEHLDTDEAYIESISYINQIMKH